jgi:hypothetical protein
VTQGRAGNKERLHEGRRDDAKQTVVTEAHDNESGDPAKIARHHVGVESDVSLADLPATGHDSRRMPFAERYRDCSDAGRLQAQAPVPTRGPGEWMA